MGSASRDGTSSEKLNRPGPGSYTLKSPTGSGTAIGFGTSSRGHLGGNLSTPGPGSYSSPSKVGEGPKVKSF